jgi:hypothetical protein
VGSNVVEITRSQDGVTFTPLPAQQIEPDGIVSGIVTDSAGGVYIAHTGLVDGSGKIVGGSDANGNDNAVVVVRFPHGYSSTTATPLSGQTLCRMQPSTCTTSVAYRAALDSSGNSTATVGQDFTPIAMGRACASQRRDSQSADKPQCAPWSVETAIYIRLEPLTFPVPSTTACDHVT